jgi:hypothetical protein
VSTAKPETHTGEHWKHNNSTVIFGITRQLAAGITSPRLATTKNPSFAVPDVDHLGAWTVVLHNDAAEKKIYVSNCLKLFLLAGYFSFREGQNPGAAAVFVSRCCVDNLER